MKARAASRFRLERSSTDRIVAGVAAGIAGRLEIDPIVIRLAFIVLSAAGGFGVVVYLLAWLVASDRTAPAEARATSARQVVSVAMVVAGLMVLLREVGLWFGDVVGWSVGLAAFGSAILWTRADDTGRARFARLASRIPKTPADVITRRSKGRIVAGAVLVAAGMTTFLAANTSFGTLRNVAFAVMVTAAGLGLVLGPWIYELARQLGSERRERIRSEERAEMAAHLHDSVLQTFAMIQRASTPQEMASLARAQERELRSWLYARAPTSGSDMLSSAIDTIAGKVEQRYRVKVETVVVGDLPLDERLKALVDATGEAMNNAAKHSGVNVVSVYAEVTDDAVSVYVRDEGKGFDAAHVPADRKGIAESIVARMDRNEGTATVTSQPSEGTEVSLRLPRKRP